MPSAQGHGDSRCAAGGGRRPVHGSGAVDARIDGSGLQHRGLEDLISAAVLISIHGRGQVGERSLAGGRPVAEVVGRVVGQQGQLPLPSTLTPALSSVLGVGGAKREADRFPIHRVRGVNAGDFQLAAVAGGQRVAGRGAGLRVGAMDIAHAAQAGRGRCREGRVVVDRVGNGGCTGGAGLVRHVDRQRLRGAVVAGGVAAPAAIEPLSRTCIVMPLAPVPVVGAVMLTEPPSAKPRLRRPSSRAPSIMSVISWPCLATVWTLMLTPIEFDEPKSAWLTWRFWTSL